MEYNAWQASHHDNHFHHSPDTRAGALDTLGGGLRFDAPK